MSDRSAESPDQLTISDLIHMNARSSQEFFYGDIWKSVGKCVFCDLKEKYIIKEVNGLVLTTNIYPYIDGNLMIVPKRHVAHLKMLTEEEWEGVRMLQYVAKKLLRKFFGYKGLWLLYREGSSYENSQKTVGHLHIHLMPYKEGLVEWNYQKIKYPPRLVAKAFRENDKAMEILISRYRKKYGKTKGLNKAKDSSAKADGGEN